ncbi:peptidase MA family metallohydrolase [Candidatus Leptofilum sp.]|uniref:peptidase MA family metallohydrolase n=1 Tax=Candidatus Leptofilum sp. TaxID=3241576 RepID=UPI003B591E80
MVRTAITVLFVGWLFGGAETAWTQSSITVTRNEAQVDFPQSVTFQLEVADAGDVAEVNLVYEVDRASCLEANTAVPIPLDGNEAEWTWEMVRSGNPPPGATLRWSWQITDSSGNVTTTDEQSHTFVDERFEWQTVTAPNIRLHWYEGDQVGPILLDAAVAGLDQLQNEMGITLDNEVQLFIYGESDDMRDAVLYIQEWAGGVAFSDYNIILIGVPPRIAESWGVPTVRHELAHLVIGEFGRSCVGGSRPTWLNEGLAVYAEGEPSETVQSDIANGIENNSFEPVRSLNGAFSAHGPEAGIAYSQSYSVVKFLLETYGQEQMQSLLLTLAEGEGYDEALEAVYGFNVDGLEQEWRQSLNLPARDIPPTPTAVSAQAIPTIEPFGLPESVPTEPAAAATAVPPTPTGNPTGGICNLTVFPVLLVGFGLVTRRRK